MTTDAPGLSAEQLAEVIREFFTANPNAVVLEHGRVQFDMRSAQFTVSGEHRRCTLHLWSEENNVIRRVTAVRERKKGLVLTVERMGQAAPETLELVAGGERKTAASQSTARSRFGRVVERVIAREFSGYRVEAVKNTLDLQRSFGPGYARGVMHRGQSAWAVIAAAGGETQATIDGVLTVGILWLAHCREHAQSNRLFQGLKVILPRGTADVSAARMRWLNAKAAKWELYELDAETEELRVRDVLDQGNLETRFPRAVRGGEVRERFAASIDTVLGMVPAADRVEVVARSTGEVGFLLHGLEFARARSAFVGDSFARTAEILFGVGANETVLTPATEELFRSTMAELFARRSASGSRQDALYRMQPERWLESELRHKLGLLDTTLDGAQVYSQVPAFAAADRGVLDLVAATHAGRLVVLELKADEDMHLALQGLDYWIRVRQHHAGNNGLNRDDFKRNGYFPGRELSAEAPLLYYVMPSLRLHPATEVVLRHFSPEVMWTLLGIDERWRDRIRVVFRKHGGGAATK